MEPQKLDADDSRSAEERGAPVPLRPLSTLPRIVIEPGLRNALILLLIGFIASGVGGVGGIVLTIHEIGHLPPHAVIGQISLTLELVGITALCAALNVTLGIIILLLGGRTPLVWLMFVFLLFSSFLPFALGEITKIYLVKAHHLVEDVVDQYS